MSLIEAVANYEIGMFTKWFLATPVKLPLDTADFKWAIIHYIEKRVQCV